MDLRFTQLQTGKPATMSTACALNPPYFDGAYHLRRQLIESVSSRTRAASGLTEDDIRRERLEFKRNAAKALLGMRWVLHPDYPFHPRHSTHPWIWRTVPGVLDEIRARASIAGRL
jgi:hypothetical protein